MKDNIQAPWIGNDDYGKRKGFSQDDYEWYHQDDWRKGRQEQEEPNEEEDDT